MELFRYFAASSNDYDRMGLAELVHDLAVLLRRAEIEQRG